MKLPGFFKRLKPDRKTARADLVAGVVLGVESVPDALASGVLAGVNPLYALYAVMMGTPVGAIFSGSVYLSVQTTSAMALVVASVPVVTSGDSPGTLFALSLLTGVIMLVAGFLKAGRLLRWVANSEMVGFMTGVAALIILGQLGDLTGYSSEYSNKVAKAVDLLFNLDQVDLPTVAVGIGTIILIIVLQKTRLARIRPGGGDHRDLDPPVALWLGFGGQGLGHSRDHGRTAQTGPAGFLAVL